MANFLSVIANMFRSGGRYNIQRPTPKKRQTYKPYTREEISKVESTSRLPQFMQREVYKADPKLAKRVAQLTPKALEVRPFVSSVMNVTGQDIIKKLEASTGQDIDTKKVEQSALWKAGNIAGEVANFALTGGAAGGAVTNLITKGAKLGTLAKLGANVGGEAIAATPYNVTQAATTALGSKNPEKEFAKNLAINTAMDVGIGGAIGVAPLIVKALKKVPDTKPIGDALEKGGYVKDAVDAEKKIAQAVKNVQQRKLKAGSTVTQPMKESELPQELLTTPITPKVTKKTARFQDDNILDPQIKQAVADIQYRGVRQINDTLSEMPQKEKVSNSISDMFNKTYRQWINSFEPIEAYAKKLTNKADMDRILNAVYNVRQGEQEVQSLARELKDATEQIKSIVDYKLWNTYNSHIQNIYRPKNKRVLAGVSKEESQRVIANMERDYPELLDAKAVALDIQRKMDEYDVSSGNMSAEDKARYRQEFPDYFPVARALPNTVKPDFVYNKKTSDVFKVYKVKGGEADILPWHVGMYDWIDRSVKSAKLNELGKVLSETGGKIRQKGTTSFDMANLEKSNATLGARIFQDGDRFKLDYLENGKPAQIELTQEEYQGLSEFFNPKTHGSFVSKIAKGTRLFKDLVVNWNVFFAPINALRDNLDAPFYTKNLGGYLVSYPKAVIGMFDKANAYTKAYMDSGVSRSQFVSRDILSDGKFSKLNPLKKIEALNALVERAPRMAEFVSTVDNEIKKLPEFQQYLKDKGEALRNPTQDEVKLFMTNDIRTTAARNASEITLDFNRNGKYGKILNETVVPFFNPALQGTDRIARLLKMTKSERRFQAYAGLATKFALWGTAPAVLNELLYRNDEDYQKLSSRDKDINYIFKIADGKFLKIPKGRLMSVISTPVVEAIRPDDADTLTTAKMMANQIGPINPLSSNLFSPINALFTGKDWMGYDIESKSLQDELNQNKWDSSTSEVGKLIGGFTGKYTPLSPQKVDYIIDGYSGFLGDTLLPFLTKGYLQGRKPYESALLKRFVVDSNYQNNLATNFYDTLDEAQKLSKEKNASEKDKMYYKFLSRYNDDLSDIRKQIESVQLSDISNKEARLDELQAQLNATYETAMRGYENFEMYLQDVGAESSYEETVAKSQGGGYSDYSEFFTKSKEDYKEAEKAGIPAETYFSAFSEMSTDGNNRISQKEAYDYLEKTDLTTAQKAVMWEKVNKGWKKNPYKGDTIGGGGSRSGGSTRTAAKKYRDGLATSQVKALENLTVQSPNLTSAEIKAIIKMLSA